VVGHEVRSTVSQLCQTVAVSSCNRHSGTCCDAQASAVELHAATAAQQLLHASQQSLPLPTLACTTATACAPMALDKYLAEADCAILLNVPYSLEQNAVLNGFLPQQCC